MLRSSVKTAGSAVHATAEHTLILRHNRSNRARMYAGLRLLCVLGCPTATAFLRHRLMFVEQACRSNCHKKHAPFKQSARNTRDS
jgi:hypothetical protein